MAEEAEILLKAKFENGQAVIDATKSINKNLDQMGQSAEDAGKKTSNLLDYLKKIAAVVGIAAVANQFKNLVKGSLEAAGSMEQVNIALTTMLGSGQKAKKLTEELIGFAKKTPFQIEGIFQSTKQLLAYGFAQEQVIPTLTTLGNIAAGVGTDLQGLAYGLGKVSSNGKLTSEILNIFGDRGVPLIKALSEVLNVSSKEVLNLVEKGKVGLPAVTAALESMTKEGGKFFNLMDAQSKSFLGTVSNIQDNFFQVKVALGDALLPVAKEVVNSMIIWFGELKTIIENNKESITKFAAGFVAVFGLIGNVLKIAFGLVMDFVEGIKTLLKIPFVKEILIAASSVLLFSKGLSVLTIAFRILTASAGIWVVAIVAATTAIGFLSKNVNDLPDFIKTAALQSLKLFEQLKLGIFDFVESILDKLSALSGLPMFGWVDDAKKKFEDLKKSSIGNIQAISDEIANIKTGSVDITAPDTPKAQTQTIKQDLLAAPDATKEEDARLKALKSENEALLEEQKNFLAGYGLQETEADKLIADNKTLSMQQKILKDQEYITQKQELDQQLLDGEITGEEYKRELAEMNNAAKLEALQIQYDAELVKFQENQILMDETKNEMQLTQDELELSQLQIKLQREEAFAAASIQKMAGLKGQKGEETFQQEKARGEKELQHKIGMDSKGYQATLSASNELVALQNSKNKSLAAIGKAAAMFQITNDTATGAISAYKSLSGLPVVGPALGIAAAAAVTAYGAERLSAVASNSFAVGTPNIPQDQLANVHKGEMIVPATFSEAIRSGQLTLGANDNTANNNASAVITNININFDGAKFIGQLDDDDIVGIGERLGQMIVENIIPAIPTRTA